VGAPGELHGTFIQIIGESTGYEAESHGEDLSRDHGPSPRHDREGWTDFSMSSTAEQDSETTNTRLIGEAARWRRRFGVVSVGATVATTAILGSLMFTSHQEASAATRLSAVAVPVGVRADDPPAPTNPTEMPMDMPGMDMSGSTPAPAPTAEMPQDMPGMDMGGSTPEPTIPAPMPPDMPGMDMTGDSHDHSVATGTTTKRPLAPVLGTFGGASSAVLLTAGMLRRKDRAASLAKKAARIAGRAKK